MQPFSSKGIEASQLRHRRSELSRRFGIPQLLIGGSLSFTARRCGKRGCHCVEGEGHPNVVWTLSAGGQRQVRRVPHEWASEFATMMQHSQEALDAQREVMSINAQLFALDLESRRKQKGTRQRKKSTPTLKKRSTPSHLDRSSYRVANVQR